MIGITETTKNRLMKLILIALFCIFTAQLTSALIEWQNVNNAVEVMKIDYKAAIADAIKELEIKHAKSNSETYDLLTRAVSMMNTATGITSSQTDEIGVLTIKVSTLESWVRILRTQ